MQVLERNVRQGTKVFERGHVLVLAQCVGGKDMETLWRMLNQARSHLRCAHVCGCRGVGGCARAVQW